MRFVEAFLGLPCLQQVPSSLALGVERKRRRVPRRRSIELAANLARLRVRAHERLRRRKSRI